MIKWIKQHLSAARQAFEVGPAREEGIDTT